MDKAKNPLDVVPLLYRCWLLCPDMKVRVSACDLIAFVGARQPSYGFRIQLFAHSHGWDDTRTLVCLGLLILPSKNKTTNRIFESYLKDALLNTG